MCLKITNLNFKTAEEDITVYKHAREYNDVWYSPYQASPIVQNLRLFAKKEWDEQAKITELVETIYDKESDCYFLEYGFHSFPDILQAIVDMNDVSVYYNNSACVFECIIPKGSVYIIGTFGDVLSIASEEIIYKEICYNRVK